MCKKISKLMLVLLVTIFAVSITTSAVFAQANMYPAKKAAVDWVDANQARMEKLSKAIWSYAELPWQEFKSSAALREFLKDNGFRVDDVPGFPTAFKATYGSGKPVIGIMGEFDALPMTSQKAGVTKRDPLVAIGNEAGPGHSCGHSYFGVGSAGAAVAAAKAMEKNGIKGTIIMLGTPAEEGGEGKTYLSKAGFFKNPNIDVILTWHPGDSNQTEPQSNNARYSVKYAFTGKTSHAGSAPEKGRSALDAAVITDVCVQYIREHMKEANRIHSVFTKGGVSPNVVPDFAEIWYFVRAPEITELKDLFRRVTNCAKAGALGTDTAMKMDIKTVTWNYLPNLTLAQISWDNLNLLRVPQFTDEEQAWAKEVQKNAGLPQRGMDAKIGPRPTKIGKASTGSSDDGNVTWVIPGGRICGVATYPLAAAGHSWQIATGGNHTTGMKGMIKASQVIAATAVDLVTYPKLISEITKEWKERKGGIEYEDLLAPDSTPSFQEYAPEMRRFIPLLEKHYLSPK